jgi:hypothetical protein
LLLLNHFPLLFLLVGLLIDGFIRRHQQVSFFLVKYCSILGFEKCVFVSLEGDWLKDPVSFLLVPARIENLKELTSALLNFHIHMVCILFYYLLDSAGGRLKTDSKLREGSENPADYRVRAFSFFDVFIEDFLIKIDDFVLVDDDWLAVSVLRSSIHKHLSELAH